jgi:hypothetical protein
MTLRPEKPARFVHKKGICNLHIPLKNIDSRLSTEDSGLIPVCICFKRTFYRYTDIISLVLI